MSIRHGLLALLDRSPMYGYQLRANFEESTGGAWQLNIGQVYTTLARLERDGLVRALAANDGGQRPFEITVAGRGELAMWFDTPVTRATRPRDELTIKLALALSTPLVDAAQVLTAQRTASVMELRNLVQARRRVESGDRARQLALDALVFQAEAEIRWLDHCEATVLPGQDSPTPAPTSRPTR